MRSQPFVSPTCDGTCSSGSFRLVGVEESREASVNEAAGAVQVKVASKPVMTSPEEVSVHKCTHQ